MPIGADCDDCLSCYPNADKGTPKESGAIASGWLSHVLPSTGGN